jgi:hypothetical protein
MSNISGMKSVPPDSQSRSFVPRDIQSELEKEVPEEQSGNFLGIKNMTHEGASPSSLYSCLNKLWSSIYKFFSYVSYYFTCCFSKGSFQNVTRNQNAPLVISDDQKKAAQILREYSQNENIMRQYGGVFERQKRFYIEQKEFLINYLQYLQASVVDLNNTIQNKTEEIKEEGEPSILIQYIVEKLQHLKNQSEYKSLANSIELAESIESRLLINKILDNGASILSAKTLSGTIELKLERLTTMQDANDRLQKELRALYNNNHDFLSMANRDDSNLIPGISATMDHATLVSLETFNEEDLERLRNNNKKTEAGFENNMLVFQNDIQMMVNQLQGALNAIKVKRAQKLNRAANRARLESLIRGGRNF